MTSIVEGPYPQYDPRLNDPEAEDVINDWMTIITAFRKYRADNKLKEIHEVIIAMRGQYDPKLKAEFEPLLKYRAKIKKVTWQENLTEEEFNLNKGKGIII